MSVHNDWVEYMVLGIFLLFAAVIAVGTLVALYLIFDLIKKM